MTPNLRARPFPNYAEIRRTYRDLQSAYITAARCGVSIDFVLDALAAVDRR